MKKGFALLLAVAFTTLTMGGCVTSQSSAVPRMRMTTAIPESIIVPDKIETRLGTLEFFDGFPSKKTAQTMHDYLYFHRAVDVFLDEMSAASIYARMELYAVHLSSAGTVL